MSKIGDLTPFKICILNNFPFLENTIYTLDNYGLMCRLIDKLNVVVDITNEQTEAINKLIEWFNDLDISSEVNDVLDKMIEDGTFDRIIENTIGDTIDTINEQIETLQTRATNLTNTLETLSDNFISKSDNYIVVSDTEPIELNREKVWFQFTKNLLKFPAEVKTINGVTIELLGDGSIKLNGTSSSAISTRIGIIQEYLAKGTYTLSYIQEGYKTAIPNMIFYGRQSDSVPGVELSNTRGINNTFTTDIDYNTYYFWFYIGAAVTFTDYIVKPQLERGNTPTSYSPFVENKIHILTENGYVKFN